MAIFKKYDYAKYSTQAFKKEINKQLVNIYGKGSGVRLVPESVDYVMISDSDYSTDWEQIKFNMTDGRKFEVFYEHKGLSTLTEITE